MFTYETYPVAVGFGYKIFADGSSVPLIDQYCVAGAEGNDGYLVEADAQAAAEAVIAALSA